LASFTIPLTFPNEDVSGSEVFVDPEDPVPANKLTSLYVPPEIVPPLWVGTRGEIKLPIW
jgi:hypothetical protein